MAKIHKLEDRVVLDGAAVDAAESLSSEVLHHLSDSFDQALAKATASAPLESLAEGLSHTAIAPMEDTAVAVVEAITPAETGTGISVSIVSNDLPNYEVLMAMQGPQHRVVVVDAQSTDSATVIQDLVESLQSKGQTLRTLNIMSHGGGGYFSLGQDTITASTLDRPSWQALSGVMSDVGRINLYGCNLVDGSGGGVDLLNELSQVTGSDVFGSDDLTGVGGDWDLEVASDGAVLVDQIDAPLVYAALTDWQVTMAGPTAVDTMVWLRADTGVYQDVEDGTESTTSGDDVRFWQDQSGNDHHVKIGDGEGDGDPIYTEAAIGGQDAVTFDGNDRLQFVDADGNASDLVLPGSGWTMFLVWETTDGTNAVVQYQLGGVDQGILAGGSLFQTKWGLIGDDASENNIANGASPTGDTYATFYQHSIYHEGSLVDSYQTEAADASSDITLDSVGGRRDAVSLSHVGHIAEVIIYDHELNAAERILVEDYLNTRYGFNAGSNEYSLDSSEGVDQDVTGIGRDASTFSDWDGQTHTGLDNPDDAHQASSSGVTITGSADDTAAEGSATELDIGEAVFLGHDGTELGQTLAEGAIEGAGIEAYLSRSWGIEKAGPSAAQITIAFDLSDTSGTGITEAGTASNYELLYRASAGDDWTVVSLAAGDAETDGDLVTFTVADDELANGLYTLGTRSTADSALGLFNADPVINDLDGDVLSFTEDTDISAIVLDQAAVASLTDADGRDFNGGVLTVSVSDGAVAEEDELGIRDQGAGASNVTVSGGSVFYGGVEIGTFTGGSGGSDLLVTFNTNADATAVSALLRNVTYFNNESDEPTEGARVVDLVMTDGDGGQSDTVQVTVNVVASNDAPTLSATLNTASYSENAVAVTIANPDFSIATVESGQTVEQLVFFISNLEQPASERLTFDGTSISLNNGEAGTTSGNGYSYSVSTVGDTATVTLTKAGVSVAATETLVKAAAYNYIGEDLTAGDTREVSLQVQDSGGGSDTSAERLLNQISVLPVNDDPTAVGAPGDVDFTEDMQSNLDLSSINLGDVDDSSLTLTLTASAGTLSANSGDGVTVSGTGTGRLTLSGTIADLNGFLDDVANLQYQGASNDFGDDAASLTVHGNDGESGDVLLATANIDISAVNDDPVLTVNAGLTLTGGESATLTRDMLRITDVEQAPDVLTLTLTAVPDQGSLLLGAVALGEGDGLNQQDIDDGLLTFQANGDDAGTVEIRFTANDGQGGVLFEQVFTININAQPQSSPESDQDGDEDNQDSNSDTQSAGNDLDQLGKTEQQLTTDSDLQPGVIIDRHTSYTTDSTGDDAEARHSVAGGNEPGSTVLGLAGQDGPGLGGVLTDSPLQSLDLGGASGLERNASLSPGSSSNDFGDIVTAAGANDSRIAGRADDISRFATAEEEEENFSSVSPESVGAEIATRSLPDASLRGDSTGEEDAAELFVDDQSETFGARARELVDLFEERDRSAVRSGVEGARGAATQTPVTEAGLLRVAQGGQGEGQKPDQQSEDRDQQLASRGDEADPKLRKV